MLKLAARYVTARRDREADALTTVWNYRRIASLLEVNASTMQGWVAAGAKARAATTASGAAAVDSQQVSRGTTALNSVKNSNWNGSELAIR